MPITLDMNRPVMPTFDLFSTIYRTPVCINTDTKEVYVGQY